MIKIKIIDQNNLPVIDALIYNGKDFFYTNEIGETEVENLNLPFQIAAVGHKNKTVSLSQEKNQVITLERISGDLKEIEIVAERPVEKKKFSLIFLLILITVLIKK
jgi:hypothetical protein